MQRRRAPEGIRVTRVGLVYILLTLLVGLAATNTGNNALYMVASAMLGGLVVSGLLSRGNVRGIDLRLEPPDEVFAGRPFRLRVTARHRRGWLPRWEVLVSISRQSTPRLIPFLRRRGVAKGSLPALIERRGRHVIDAVHLASLFPFGLLRKGLRESVQLELLVFPEVFDSGSPFPEQAAHGGQQPTPMAGRGHELMSLREFRPGDDPRHIHWKQTARTGDLIVVRHQAESGRRLTIVLDNAVGELRSAARAARFERLISEAATAAVHALARGTAVELVTRDEHIASASGPVQRRRILESLALMQAVPVSSLPLTVRRAGAAQLRLGLESEPVETVA